MRYNEGVKTIKFYSGKGCKKKMTNIKLPQVKGYEIVDFRQVEKGEEYIDYISKETTQIRLWEISERSNNFYFVLKKLKTMRDANSNDFSGFSRVCQYSHNGETWRTGILWGVRVEPELFFWVHDHSSRGYFWVKFCRIEE